MSTDIVRLELTADEALVQIGLIPQPHAEELIGPVALDGLERARDHRDGRLRDTVTGLLVRDAFLDEVTQRVESASSFGEEVAFCVVSLDSVERISQEYGLRAADRVLATLGQLARASFRATDALGRWGAGAAASWPSRSTSRAR
jgi:GGDEF domain-containing protein